MSELCVELFRALADATRQNILSMLEAHEKSVNEICGSMQHMTQPTISHHLQILKRCKLVSCQRKGKMIYYSLNKKTLRNSFEEYVERFDIEMM